MQISRWNFAVIVIVIENFQKSISVIVIENFSASFDYNYSIIH